MSTPTPPLHNGKSHREKRMSSKRQLARIGDLTRRLRALETRVSELSEGGAMIVPITTLAPEPYDLLREIKVVVQPASDEFLATFFDANVNATGCNETEAVDNLKEILTSRFEYLDRLAPTLLGPAPSRQIAILRTFMRRSI